ncbi:MAG: tetratricopeptide repeat protein [Brevinematales bacterium]|nr:tetratricopeptide repeat protein [Brevinematales bacterium]
MKRFFLFCFIFYANFLFSNEIGQLRATYKEALADFANGNILKAESNFIKITRNPNRNIKIYRDYIAKSHYFLGEIYFVKEEFKKSILNYRIVLEKFPDEEIYPKALYKLGRTLIISERIDEGIGVLEEFIIKYPEDTNLTSASYYWLGRGYQKKGEREKAIQSYQKLLTNYPDSSFSYEVREILKTFSEIRKNETNISQITIKTNIDIQKQQEKKQKLEKEKELLKKISTLLEIKQKLLEIKLELLNESAKTKEEDNEE